MAATLEQLVSVRSGLVLDMLDYLSAIEQELAKNPLLDRFGRSLNELRVPLRVVPYEPVRDIEQIRAREHLRETGSPDQDEDEISRRVYAFRHASYDEQEKQGRLTGPEPLDKLESDLQMAVLLGDPGSGKTEWLKYRAGLAARQSREELENGQVAVDDIVFPAYLRLTEISQALEDEAVLRDLIAGCIPVCPAVLSDTQLTTAAILYSLVKHHSLPVRLVHWLWHWLTREQQGTMGTSQVGGQISEVLLCLDAWDEVREGQDDLAQCLYAFARNTYARIFLTSRVIGYGQRPIPVTDEAEGTRELQICPFEWRETEIFVKSFFKDDPDVSQSMLGELRGKVAVAGMAQNPLLATLLCMAFAPSKHHQPLGFPARRVEVYERVLKGLLGEWEVTDKGRPPNWDIINAKISLLGEMAYHFFPDEELSAIRLHDFLWHKKDGYMTKLDDVHPLKQMLRRDPNTTLIKELCNDGLLVPCGGTESFIFLHMTFQEYLTASFLAWQINSQSWNTAIVKLAEIQEPVLCRLLADKKAWHPVWREVIILLAGKLGNPGPLLEMLANPKPTSANPNGDDLFEHRLILAALCLSEVSHDNRRSENDIVDTICTRIFFSWRLSHRGRRVGDFALGRHLTQGIRALLLACCHVRPNMVPNELLPPSCVTRDEVPLADCLSELLREPERPFLESLGDIEAAAAIPGIFHQLVRLLRDRRQWVRAAVAAMLRGAGAAAATPEILTRLVTLLGDEWNRGAAAKTLQAIGAAAATPEILSQLVRLLGKRDVDDFTTQEVAYALGAMGSAAATPEILSHLAILPDLGDPHNWIRRKAVANALRGMGAAAATPEVLSQLVSLLTDPEVLVRYAAVEALGAMGTAAANPKTLLRLATLLVHKCSVVRSAAAKTVAAIGTEAATPEIVSRLAGLLTDQGLRFESRPANAAGGVGSTTTTSPWSLSRTSPVKKAAARALAALGEAAATSEILSLLFTLLGDKDRSVRLAAVSAVGVVGAAAATPEILSRLRGLLGDKDRLVRQAAAREVGTVGAAAATPETLLLLVRLMRDKNKGFRETAIDAVRGIGAAAATPKILSQLIRLLEDQDFGIWNKAAKAFGALEAAAATPETLSRLGRLLRDKDRWIRYAATKAVSSIGAAAATPEILSQLARLLEDEFKYVRRTAAEAVASMKAAAATPEILSRLTELLGDKYPFARIAAARALGGMQARAATPEIVSIFLEIDPKLLAVSSHRSSAEMEDKYHHAADETAATLKRMMAAGIRIFGEKWHATEIKQRLLLRTVVELSQLEGPNLNESHDSK